MLTDQSLHLWRWRAPTTGDLAGEFALLNDIERKRVQRLRRPADRRVRIVSRSGMRRLLGQYLDVAPADIPIRYGPLGRPHLDCQRLPAMPNDNTMLNFNLSHAGEWVVMVVSLADLVGIDIELPRDKPPSARLIERICSLRERAVLMALEPAQAKAAFYRAWTRKEAILKATGGSIFHASASFDVSLGEADQPTVYRPPASATQDWQLFNFGWDEVVGAIAIRAGDWALSSYRLSV